jgi:hypothetical protein
MGDFCSHGGFRSLKKSPFVKGENFDLSAYIKQGTPWLARRNGFSKASNPPPPLEIEVNSYRLKAGGRYVSRENRIERSRKNGR